MTTDDVTTPEPAARPDAAAIPYTFDRSHAAAELHEKYVDAIETGAQTDDRVQVAGRVMLRRGQGKLAFVTLADSSGRIQLFAPADVTQDFARFTELSLGDWIGVTGTMMRTRKGELSVQVESWEMLAPTRRAFPDKWHGLSDTDTRYRQRYVDLWVTDEARRTFQIRSRAVSLIRRWLEDRGFMEVETPILQTQPGGALAKPFVTHHNALDMDMYLRIAPELYLKRLVVGGFEKVFEIGRNFRNEGISPRHDPQFTMLEVYEAYGDYQTGMTMVEEMSAHVAQEILGTTKFEHQGREIDLTPPWPRRTLVDLVSEAVGQPVDLETPIDELRAVLGRYVDHVEPSWGPGKLLFELYEKTTETNLWGPVFVMDIPKEVSPLARDHRSTPGMAEHADLVIGGREVAPIYTELNDPDEQRARFDDQVRQREAGDDEAMLVDEDYLRALDYGLPPTAGFGFGIDRFIMLLADVSTIRDVVLFPTLRPEQGSSQVVADPTVDAEGDPIG